MTDKDEKTIREIEQTWSGLRANIEQAKRLAEKTDRLIQQHRDELKKDD